MLMSPQTREDFLLLVQSHQMTKNVEDYAIIYYHFLVVFILGMF